MKLSELKRDSAGVAPITGREVETSASAEEPWGVSQVVTPDGLEIYYQAGPKRLYRVRNTWRGPGVDTPADWVEVPSASTVLDVLEKGGLSWWGMKVGAVGVAQLLERGCLIWDSQREDPCLVHKTGNERGGTDWADVKGEEALADLLTFHKMSVNHVKGAAADRGTNVHSALELYADTGTLPNPENYPESEAGYVRGLVAFLTDTRLEVEMSEVMVASTAGYAGRFDCVGRLPGGKAVTKTYPKRSDIVDVIDPKWRFLLDLKTSKGVYPSYHIQLGGYEGGLEECGYGQVDKTAVVRVTSDGRYELVFGRATQEDFLAVLDVYRLIKRIEGKS